MDIIAGKTLPEDRGADVAAAPRGAWDATRDLCAAWAARRAEDGAPSKAGGADPPADAGGGPPADGALAVADARELPTFARTCWVFAQRAATQVAREPQLLALDCGMQLFAGCLFGALYRDVSLAQLPTAVFMLSLALGLTVGIASLAPFGAERVVFWREAARGAGMGLDKRAYFLAKCLVELPRLALLTLTLLLTYLPLTNLQRSWRAIFGIACAAAFAVSGSAYAISIALAPKNAQLGVVIGVLVWVMFAGFAIPLRDIELMSWPARVVSYLSYARAAARAPLLLSSRGPLADDAASNQPHRFLHPFSPFGSRFARRYARWLTEAVFAGETFLLHDSFKAPPSAFRDPRDSALGLLVAQRFRERFTTLHFLSPDFFAWLGGALGGAGDDDGGDDGADDGDDGGGGFDFEADYDTLHQIDALNVPTLLAIGLITRAVAFACLRACNGTKMGRPSLWNRAVRPRLDRLTAALLAAAERARARPPMHPE